MAASKVAITLSDVSAEIKMWQSRGLAAGWMIEVSDDPDPDDAAAWTRWASGYRWGKVFVNLKDSAFAHPYLWRHVIIHELCHFVTAPLVDHLEANLNKDGGLYAETRRHMETVVDSFANIIQQNVQTEE